MLEKSFAFAIRVVKMCQFLCESKKEYLLSKQVLLSGTSIGANIRELELWQTTPDFYTNLSVALKEAEGTAYWLELLHEADYLDENTYKSMSSDCEELIKLLESSTKTLKTKMVKD